MSNQFQKATKFSAKLRAAISGPSGSGKTFTSLKVATEFVKGTSGKIAYVDTEHGSASKYADLFDFDVIEMSSPYHPDRFVEYLKMAEEAGYAVAIIDSLTHAWNGKGGILEIVDNEMTRKKTTNSFVGWGVATPIHNGMIEAILASKIHVICTMRSKQEYLIERDSKGKSQIRKVGLAPVQRNDTEYEFDLWMEMDLDNMGSVSKTRCPDLAGKVLRHPGKNLADILKKWLEGEAPPEKTPMPAEQSPPENSEKEAATPPLAYTEAKRKALHVMGHAVYGKKWDAKRAELVNAITGKRTTSLTEVTLTEFTTLFDGIKLKNSELSPGKKSEILYGEEA